MAKHQKQTPDSGKRTGSPFNPAHYPPGRLPALTMALLRTIAQNTEQGQLPTKQEVNAALSERQRALEKIEWMIGGARPDANERALSATATVSVTLALDTLTTVGRDYREQQQRKASGPKTPHLDAAILEELGKEPQATAREIWDALSHFDENDLKIRANKVSMEWDYLGSPESQGDLKFASFTSKVSRLRKKPSRR